jgi:hypothetical protein
MSLADRKMPIINGINSVPSSTGQPNHPNASLLCKKFNDLIDDLITVVDDMLTITQVRSAISVTGNATYNSATGRITVNALVDHISITGFDESANANIYTFWGDADETINLGTISVINGINGVQGIQGIQGEDGRSIAKLTASDNGDGTKTLTFWGDANETINLGSFSLSAGVDGVSPTVTVLTQANYNALGDYDSNTFYVING